MIITLSENTYTIAFFEARAQPSEQSQIIKLLPARISCMYLRYLNHNLCSKKLENAQV